MDYQLTYQGTALVIGGNAFGSNLPSSHVLSHEVGHCLGLYHTFHGSNLEPIGCAEYVDESNCSTCGDFICDTPADPWSIYTCINQITCAWTGYQNNACCGGNAQDAHGDYYNPNPNIIMAYTTPNCMTTHTLGQITRLFNVIGASSLLLNTIPNLVSGPIVICSGGAQFTVNNVPQGYTVSWTSSSNIILPENKNVNPIVITGVNGSGTGWMMATLVSTCGSIPLPQYSVWVGVPPLFDISGPASIVLNNTEHFVADILPRDISSYGIYYYDWSVTSKLQFESSHAYRTDAYIKGISLGFGTISFYTTNGCGTSTYNFLVRVVSSKSLSIYPNPASNEITIEIDDEANFEDTSSSLLMTENLSDTEYLVTIYNNAGMPVFFNKYSNVNEIKISTSSWQSGIYYIVLTLNGENYSGSFIIE